MDKIDIRAPKVLAPALLFAVLNSGLVFFVQKNGGNVLSGTLLVNALIFALIYFVLMKFVMKIPTTNADILVPLLLFIALTPGVLLTIPPGSKGLFMSGQTSPASVAVHTVVFALVFALLRKQFPKVY